MTDLQIIIGGILLSFAVSASPAPRGVTNVDIRVEDVIIQDSDLDVLSQADLDELEIAIQEAINGITR